MKLLLIAPPIEDFYDTEIRLQPIGLAYLKASVQKYLPHVKVKILDAHRGFGRQTIALPKEFRYLKKYWQYPDKSPFCGFYNYYHFGASFEQIAQLCQEYQPDLVGISSLFSPYHREVLQTASAIKSKINVPLLVGGSHASACPDLLLDSPDIDYVVCGEGEKSLVEFLRAFEGAGDYSNVSGLAYKVGSQRFYNQINENYPLDELPIPDLSDLKQSDYLFEGKPLCFVVTSRSCPHRCSFCSVHTTFGLTYRRMSVDCIMQLLHQRYEEGYRVFDFEDDNLTYFKPQMKELCVRLIADFKDKPIQLLAMNGISYLSLDDELLVLMRQAGFTHLNLALVSSDQSVLMTTKRPHTVSKYKEIVQKGVNLGYQITSYQILGLKGETLSSMVQTLIFNSRLPVLMGASIFYMTPNSPIAREHGLQVNDLNSFMARSTAIFWEFNDWDRSDIYTLFITTRIINFLKSVSKRSEDEADIILELDGDKRKYSGMSLIKKILEEGVLFAETNQGQIPLESFKVNLFFRIITEMRYVATLENKIIDLNRLFCLDKRFSQKTGYYA